MQKLQTVSASAERIRGAPRLRSAAFAARDCVLIPQPREQPLPPTVLPDYAIQRKIFS